MSQDSSELNWLKSYLLGWGAVIAVVFFRDSLAEPESDFGLALAAFSGLLSLVLTIAGLIRFLPWLGHLWRN